jgi:hypothetical protein
VRDYFRKKAEGEVKEDEIKESFPEEEWIWLVGLNQHVNPLLHDKLIANQDGSLRLVLEHELYEDGAGMAFEGCMGLRRRSTSKMLQVIRYRKMSQNIEFTCSNSRYY